MSYNISVTSGNQITILSGSIDTSTALTLVGKNISNYGEIFAQNFVTLMQNFASPSEPNGVLEGQLWYDSGTYSLKLYKNGSYRVVSTIASSTTAPTAPYIGDLWWDTANSLLKIWNNTTWVAIGPNVLNTSSSAVADAILDTNNVLRQILKIMVDSSVVAVFSSATFAPMTTYNGLTLIYGGMTLVGTGTTYGNIVSTFASITTLNVTTTNASQINAVTMNATSIGNANSAIRGTSATIAGTITAASVNALNIGNTGATITGTHNGSLNGPFNGNIGSVTPNTAIFTSVTADTVSATTVTGNVIGNAGATLIGTLATADQTNITSLGTLTGVTVNGTLTATTANATTINATSTNSSTMNASTVNAVTLVATNIGNSTSVISGTSSAIAGTVTAAAVNALSIGNNGAIITGTHNGPLNGPFNGTIGSTLANSAAFTTLTSTGTTSLATSSGNVGIGTSSAAAKLHVAGTLNLTSTLTISGAPGTTGQFLTSNGAGNAPTWTSIRSGGFNDIAVYTVGSYTWTVPANVTKIKVTVVGGGGAGADVASSSTAAGGGGGGGTAIKIFTVTPGQQIPLVAGAAGQTSSFASGTIYATAGAAGGAGMWYDAQNYFGGAGGSSTHGGGGRGASSSTGSISMFAPSIGATNGQNYGGGGGGNNISGLGNTAGASGVVIIEY